MSDVKITDNSKKVLSAFEEQVIRGLEAIGSTAEGYAKEDCPVDTGRLRNSIANAVVGNEVQIGTNVEYAAEVEYRSITHKSGKAHFLKDAATTHEEKYKSIMKASLKGSGAV